jgi:hypothetical protein
MNNVLQDYHRLVNREMAAALDRSLLSFGYDAAKDTLVYLWGKSIESAYYLNGTKIVWLESMPEPAWGVVIRSITKVEHD